MPEDLSAGGVLVEDNDLSAYGTPVEPELSYDSAVNNQVSSLSPVAPGQGPAERLIAPQNPALQPRTFSPEEIEQGKAAAAAAAQAAASPMFGGPNMVKDAVDFAFTPNSPSMAAYHALPESVRGPINSFVEPVADAIKAPIVGAANYAISPKGITEMSLAAVPVVGAAVKGKWAVDLAFGAKESAERVIDAMADPENADPKQVAADIGNAVASAYGAGKISAEPVQSVVDKVKAARAKIEEARFNRAKPVGGATPVSPERLQIQDAFAGKEPIAVAPENVAPPAAPVVEPVVEPAKPSTKPHRGLPDSATESDLISDMTQAGRDAFSEAKSKPDEFHGVDVTDLDMADRRNMARLGLSLSVDRNRRIIATYPARLRADDLRKAMQAKKPTAVPIEDLNKPEGATDVAPVSEAVPEVAAKEPWQMTPREAVLSGIDRADYIRARDEAFRAEKISKEEWDKTTFDNNPELHDLENWPSVKIGQEIWDNYNRNLAKVVDLDVGSVTVEKNGKKYRIIPRDALDPQNKVEKLRKNNQNLPRELADKYGKSEPTPAPVASTPEVVADFTPGSKVRIGTSPQPHTIIADTTDPKFPDERIFKVRNDKTGEEFETDAGTATAIQMAEPKAKVAKRDLDAELKAAGMDASVFRNAKEKRAALERYKNLSGPGTPSAFQGPDVAPQIEQLTQSFENIKPDTGSLKDRVSEAFNVADKVQGLKERTAGLLSTLKAAGQGLAHKWEGIETIDDLHRAKGELSAAVESRGWLTREWAKSAEKAFPNKRDQAAIAKWVDAGGDKAELARGASETKPEFRRAYEDAMALSGDKLVAAENIKEYFQSRLKEAQEADVLKEGVEDYIHRIYERRPDLQKKALAHAAGGLLQTNPALVKPRTFQFDWEAEKLGYKPVQSFIPRIAEYESSLSRAIAAREFIKKATTMKAPDGRPVIDVKGLGIPIENEGVREGTLIKPSFNPSKANEKGTANYRGDYVNREYPALSKWKWVGGDSAGKPIFVQGDVAIHPDFVDRIDRLLKPSQVRYNANPKVAKVGRTVLDVSSAMKQTMLDFSGFHQVQLAIHGLEHKVLPWKITDKIDMKNPDVQGLLKGGITLGGDYRTTGEGLVGSSLSKHIPWLGPLMNSYHGWLFQSFIPRLKMTMALGALERNRARYPNLPAEQVYQKTASQANSAFGELNYIMLERSKTAQDMARMILLAPDFLEARGRFAGEAFTKGGKKGGNEQRAALLLGALTMWTLARIINKQTDDQYHFEPENLFRVVYKGRAYGLRTVQGDILHFLQEPVQFWLNRLNPFVTRPMLEAASGRDYFGRKRDLWQQVQDYVANWVPISARSSRERSMWESIQNSFGLTEKRWSDVDDAFKLAKDWKSKHGIGDRGEFIYDSEKDPLRGLKVALHNQDEAGAVNEIKALIRDKTYTADKLNKYFERYANMPFTGSRANDVKFKATLTDDEKKTVNKAAQHKKDIQKLYWRARNLAQSRPAK
jgi:hypothetical protein